MIDPAVHVEALQRAVRRQITRRRTNFVLTQVGGNLVSQVAEEFVQVIEDIGEVTLLFIPFLWILYFSEPAEWSRGTVNQKVEPSPGVLSTPTSP